MAGSLFQRLVQCLGTQSYPELLGNYLFVKMIVHLQTNSSQLPTSVLAPGMII
jgi:hypothetical protein